MVFGVSRPKIIVGSKGSAVVGGQIDMCLERLCGSPTVIVWSQGMYGCRAKTVMGCEWRRLKKFQLLGVTRIVPRRVLMYASKQPQEQQRRWDFFNRLRRGVCSREIAGGLVAICDSRAKVSIGCVMLVGSRKITYRYVMIGIGCSVDYCGLFTPMLG